jgi:uncharacterized membrane protein
MLTKDIIRLTKRRSRMYYLKTLVLSLVMVLLLLGAGPMFAAYTEDDLPSYQLQYLGPGSPVAINNDGTVVGRLLIIGTNNYQPLVSVGGMPWEALPVPAGAMSVFPTDVNDNNVIVGVSYSPQWNPVAVRWAPVDGNYIIEELPRIPGDTSSYATGINNQGQIVGSRSALAYAPSGSGWLYSAELGVLDFVAQYQWWNWPRKINDLGQVIGGSERLDINTGVVEWIGDGPSEYHPVSAVDINNSGMMVGAAHLRSTSLNIVSVFRYIETVGWQYIYGTSRYTFAYSINNPGDVSYSEWGGAGLYLEGLGNFALWSLLDPAVIDAGWQISGAASFINDQRMVAAIATNSQTSQSGTVILTPSGVLLPPTAPANLQGIPHPATPSEPYNSIDLTWENTSLLTQSYELERRETGTGDWIQLALTPPGTATNHTDTAIGLEITYDYRVRAIGLGGASPWSDMITVTAPGAPPDTTPPVISILTPANGATISGKALVLVEATDDVAVDYLEVSFWNERTGQREVYLGSIDNSGTLSVIWVTSSLSPDAYVLRAYAHDAAGNWSESEITVYVVRKGRAGLAR